jgi:predicted ATPase/DNA-binding SARP family transcriptional activator
MLEVKFLGQFSVTRDGSSLTIPTRNAQSLFAYLVLNSGKAYRRERLAGLLWPDSTEGNARSNLRHELWRLRKALETGGESYFLIDDLTIAFDPQSEYSLDVDMLESAVLEQGTAEDLITALSLYQGELLPGFYDEWVTLERDRLIALHETGMARLLEILQAEGRWAEVLEWGTRWIALGGWPEPAYRALMSAYANSGDVSKAVATYERFIQGLQKDLGVDPSEQTQVLYRRIKAGWGKDGKKAPPTRANLPPRSTEESYGPTLALQLARARRSNLPRPLTSFIGREKELEQVESLVAKARLVTITGSGGVGKTRLAIQAAEALIPNFKDGVWWVELAALSPTTPPQKRESEAGRGRKGELTSTDLVAQAVVKSMRIPNSPDFSPVEALVEHMHDKQLLLVLDNCEHLIDPCAALVERMLAECPDVTIFTTSREALGVPGEKARLLPSLSLPGRDLSSDYRNIFHSEAVSLFIERAADILPGYKPGEADARAIAQICQHLGGIPLAIELAAARMNLLSAQEIAARLDHRFSLLTGGHRTALPRHKTLRAAIEWSYDLLSEPEQLLFGRLSIFAGSFTLGAAEEICAVGEIHREEVFTLLGRLVDKSLLSVEPAPRDKDLATRYRFLDTIRSFGRLKLDEAEETRLMHDRHATYFVRLVETAEPELLLQNQNRWYRLIRAENDNIRAVVEWSVESDQAENALRLVAALLWYWYIFSPAREGRDLALKALGTPSALKFKHARARALNTAGYLQGILGETGSARQSLEEAMSILKTSDDETSLAWSMQFLGVVYSFESDFAYADTAFKEGMKLLKKSGAEYRNNFLFFWGDVDLQKGDRSRAITIYKESASIFQNIGNKSFLAYPLRRLGYLALEQNDISNAWEYFRESTELNVEVGDYPGFTACLASLSALMIHLDEPIKAARLYGLVEKRLDALQIFLLYLDQVELERIKGKLHALLDEATFTAAYNEGWEMSEEQAFMLVNGLFKDKRYSENRD